MILIEYEIRNSKIHGAGMFTKQNIKKGELIAKSSPELDVDITEEIFNTLREKEKSELLYWGFYDKSQNVYHCDFDNTKFINHSINGNITQDQRYQDMYLIAKRDIDAREELTQNYLEFESKEDLLNRGILE